jgi:hypothetical protein
MLRDVLRLAVRAAGVRPPHPKPLPPPGGEGRLEGTLSRRERDGVRGPTS